MSIILPAILATLTVNFNAKIAPVRPALHSSGFGPTICSQTQRDLEDVKSMGFKAARTHDWALINPNERCCDWHHIFPLAHLDATKPENYHFGPTDYLLRRTREETGLDIFFRLGTSIEHSGKKIHFNAAIPTDFDKVAETFAATIRHYNRGWANGYDWNIKYWEIWNEPDGTDNMWCLPEGDEDWRTPSPENTAKRLRRRALFVKFFVTCLKRIRTEFGDTVKVGGPAFCGCNVPYFKEIFEACRAAGVAPDFVSWHGYTNDPRLFARNADEMRKLCDSYGFRNCELIVNEWHYFGANYNWDEMQRCSDPLVKARIWEGPDSHNGIRSAAFTVTTLANLQLSKLDQAYYYGCRHTGSWGFKDNLQNKYKVFYALQFFGELMRNYTDVCALSTEGNVTAFAVRSAAGRKALLLVDYGGGNNLNLSVKVQGIPPDAKPVCRMLSHGLNAVPYGKVALKDGKLTVTKPDFFSAVALIEF